MKKLLVAVLAMASVSAFAQKHMVRFSGIGSHDGAGDVNVSFDNTENAAGETSSTEIALNYAYTIAPMWQIGVGDDYLNDASNTRTLWTVSGYYNFATDLANAYYVGLHYTFAQVDSGAVNGAGEDDDYSAITVEAGKRFALGSWQGFNLTYAPNVTYGMAKVAFDAPGVDDTKDNSLNWNFLKFDVLF